MSLDHDRIMRMADILANGMTPTSKNLLDEMIRRADDKSQPFTTEDLIKVLREVCATQNKSEKVGNNMRYDK